MQKDQPQSNFLVKKRVLVISFVWILVQVFVYWRFGIVEDFEAAKYIVEAENILRNGSYSTGNFVFYSVEILLIAFSKMTGTYPWFPVIFQLAVNAFSVYCFYRLSRILGASVQMAFFSTLFFLAMYFYHSYNFHLFTESLYYSLGIIYTYILFSFRKPNPFNLLILLLALSLLYFSRPNGIFFIPATILFVILRFYKTRAGGLIAGVGLLSMMVLYILLNYALSSGGEFDFLLPYREAHIICGVPTVDQPYPIIIPFNYNSLEGFWYLLTHYPGLFLELALKKFIAFWGVVRSYYSTAHNIFIVAYFYPLYFLLIKKIPLAIKYYRAETVYFFILILFAMITVIFSCDDWHNRFILALLPFFILMASARRPLNG